MKGAMIGTLVSAVGYGLAIYGGWVLYRNAAPEVGIGRIPVVSGKDAPDFFKKQQGEIQSRRVGNRTGFGCITVGATLQLLGTLISGFVPN